MTIHLKPGGQDQIGKEDSNSSTSLIWQHAIIRYAPSQHCQGQRNGTTHTCPTLGTAYMGWSTCWVNLSLLDTMLGKPAYWCRERSQLDATLEMHNANLHLIGSCCEKYRLVKWYRCNIIGWMYVFSSFMCPHTCIYIYVYILRIYIHLCKNCGKY